MRWRALLRTRRASVGSTAFLSATVVALVVAASVSQGIPVNHVNANDASVWLVNDQQGAYGQFDGAVGQLQRALPAAGGFASSYNLDVLQDGSGVVGFDRTRDEVYAIDPTAGTLTTAGVLLPGGKGSRVAFANGVLAAVDPAKGDLWGAQVGTSAVSLASFRVTGTPLASARGLSAVAVAQDGTIFAASSSQLVTASDTTGGLARPTRKTFSEPLGASLQVTAVGSVPVVLDASSGRLVMPDTGVAVQLPASALNGRTVIQQPGPASPTVLVGTDTGLYAAPLAGGAPVALASAPTGTPAAPVLIGGCAEEAWSGGPGRYSRVCVGVPPYSTSLPGPPLTTPVFRVNHGRVLLNDVADGASWDVANRPAVAVSNGDWLKVLASQQPQSSKTDNSRINSADSAAQSQKPKAVDETFKARPGRTTILHVLDYDSDPSGDVLSIASLRGASGPGFSATITPDAQTVAATLAGNVQAAVHFPYTIVDAHGRSASGTITVVPTTGNTPPHLRPGYTPTTYDIASGATAGYQVLSDWRDDEGDPISLVDTGAPSGQVSGTGDGVVTFTAPVVATDTPLTINYHVTDGLSAPVAGHLSVLVLGRGDTTAHAARAVPDVAEVTVGQPFVIKPLSNDIPGADPLRPGAVLTLAGPVAPVPELAVTTDITAGTVTVDAQRPGIYLLTYQAAFGSAPLAGGQIMVTAKDPSTAADEPVTVPIAVLIHGQNPSSVDVAANDYDPAGGLLSVVSVNAPPGLSATVIGFRYLRIAATAASLTGQQVVSYEITNGVTAPVSGQVIVTWAPPIAAGPPVTHTIAVTVRAGSEADVPVLNAASDPAGEALHLVASAVTVAPAGAGAASVAGSVLRYAAPAAVNAPEAAQATYVVEDSSGFRTSGQLDITVNPADPVHDLPPSPHALEARVVAGGTVTIPVPTTGVDPDGDPVAVVGVTDSPNLGRVLTVSAASIVYEAYPRSGGTDTFTYEVADPYGKTGTASVRVAVIPPGQPQPPVAVNDSVIAAPGAHVLVDILANDVITPGDVVTVEPLARTNATVPPGARLVSNEMEVVAPAGPAPEVITYGITDGTGPPSLAQVTVTPQAGYDIPPVAVDDYATAPPAGQNYVAVSALANDYDPDGPAGDLTLVAAFGPGARISGQQVIIPLTPEPQSVPYEIKDPGGATAIGVIHVPAAATGPELRPGVAAIQVPAGGSTTVALSTYIQDSSGTVRLTSGNEIFTSPSSGLGWQASGYTSLRLSDVAGYNGPASVTIQVTDGATANAPGAHTVFLTIPVQVGTPTPVLRCPATAFSVAEGGSPLSLDVATVCQVWTPDPAQAATVTFTASWKHPPTGVTIGWSSDRRVLTLTGGSAAVPGQTGDLTVGVAGTTATADLTVQVTSVPLATTVPVNVAGIQTGHTATVDLRQYVSSPLPQPQINVLAVTQTGQGAAQVTHAGSTVSITPQTGTHGTMTFQVQLTDVPGRPDRVVTDSVTLQVLDVPSAPGAIQGVPSNQQVALSWAASNPNGSPIQSYQLSDGAATQQVSGTSYTWSGLTNGTPYTFTVKAVNQVGSSAASPPATFSPQSVPGTPGAVTAKPGDKEVTLTWGAANANGKPIDSYLIAVSPSPSSAPARQTVSGSSTSYTYAGLDDNVGPYTFTVTPHNALGAGPSVTSSPVYAYGTPPAPPAPAATGSVSLDQTTTTVTVSFPPVSLCDDAQACARYNVAQFKDGAPDGSTTAVSACSGGLCASFPGLPNDGSGYTYALTTTNRENLTSPEGPQSSPAVKAVGVPSQVTDLRTTAGNKSMTATFTLPASHSASLTEIQYQAPGAGLAGSWTNPGSPGTVVTYTLSGLSPKTTYPLQVRACNELSECAAWSNEAPATVYGTPDQPTVQANLSGTYYNYAVNFIWNGGGNEGQPVQSYHVCIDGTCSDTAAASKSVTYACDTGHGPHTITATVTDAKGQTSAQATATATVPTCPPETVSISEGAGETTSYCTVSDCHAIAISMSGFKPNSAVTIWYSTDCATTPQSAVIACEGGGSNGGKDNYTSEAASVDANGNASFNGRAFGYTQAHVWVSANAPYGSAGAVVSNTIQWS
ncbi:fibronectin type III domain-containing protein [Acidiferrimicrobium sp. IK]|uniref:Ig-like domain-containing protein n=1 Tax=Acidiferrimicrobium sp. IK TaxID=2871700 RepID=UPI002915D59F|nr:Ig-like domain-containing protein [Acidiferrimicrobium sp. IK]MCU4185606.1 fibronectin type III domain-containing protein [Acidiferrimicrobium sp. IK]